MPPEPTPDISAWETAYLRFESGDEETRKFVRRLRRLGVHRLPSETRAVELFCGRGNGLHALERLGFRRIEGVDLSPRLAAQYRGAATVHVADCRHLPFANESKDLAIVQGGLHHLERLPEDLERTLAEVDRILVPGGRFVVVEPWLTPFLRLTHALCRSRVVRRTSSKFDALAIMIDNERATYERWLSNPGLILDLLATHFDPERRTIAWGKLAFLGRKPGPR